MMRAQSILMSLLMLLGLCCGAVLLAHAQPPAPSAAGGVPALLAEIDALEAEIAELGEMAQVPQTGQTESSCSLGCRDDGELRKGVPLPSPRFTDNGDGTVTDELTGLLWLQNAYCQDTVCSDSDCVTGADLSWADALKFANYLQHGYCDLSDGSVAGQWRLPNVKELLSLVNYRFADPAVSNAMGDNLCQSVVHGGVDDCSFVGDNQAAMFHGDYWSSTPRQGQGAPPTSPETNYRWCVDFIYGETNPLCLVTDPVSGAAQVNNVWAVRDPQ